MHIPIRPRPLRRPGTGTLARPADRLEAAVTVLLLTAALTMIWAAVFAGELVTDQVRRQEQAGLANIQYRAVATVVDTELPVRPPLPPGDGINAPWRVPVVWTAPDGTHRAEDLLLPGPRAKGDPVSVIVGRDGTATTPGGELEPRVAGLVVGFFTLLTGWVCLGLTWLSIERLFIGWNSRRWAAEWRRVEPRWTGRAG